MDDAKAATEEVMRRVEAATGKPVLVTADPSLRLIATISPAGPNTPAHLVRYNPSATGTVDYLTCFQCSFILRMTEVSADKRFEVAATYRGRKDVDHLLREHGQRPGATAIPKAMRESIRDQIYDGLIRQLRSVPLGLRVDAWLAAEFPALGDQQRAIATRTLRENLTALGPEVRRFAPEKVFSCNATMNAAFAAFWARAWSDTNHTSPYKAAGLLDRGEQLLALNDAVSAEPAYDRELITAWGDFLGLNGWFEFTSYRG